jgi:BirA family transcriptional regulator, biotin operon repressor / biotin---[acetyl-CoA-carboxylase] ligase
MTPDERHCLIAETWIRQVEHHAVLPSTNDRAKELARMVGVSLPALVIADAQTAGRGRGGNRWWTGEGSLAFSVLFDAESICQGCSATPLTGLAAGLAVVATVRPLVKGRDVGLHWPNDVFADGAKLAGVLVEVLPDGKTVVGIGVNLNNSAASAPTELRAAITTLRDLTGKQHDRLAILISLLNHVRRFFNLASDSPEKLAAAADAACLQKGQPLRLQWGAVVHSGRCRGIDRTGAILLDYGESVRAFSSGILLKNV